MWTLWEVRNELVFKDIQQDVTRAVDLVKFRLGWWFKHFGKGSDVPITHILLNIVECCSGKPKRDLLRKEAWSPPMVNALFFNVDGSVLNPPGPAGIGGVLRDHNGKVLCVFSKYVGIHDVLGAELLAILRACELVGLKGELAFNSISVISDSRNAVNWIKGTSPGCFSYDHIIDKIRRSLGLDISVEFRSRSSNSFADTLAKKGLKAGVDELWWSG